MCGFNTYTNELKMEKSKDTLVNSSANYNLVDYIRPSCLYPISLVIGACEKNLSFEPIY